jgi:hypothetical protein
MPGSRSERARKPTRDDALGKAWAAAVQNGAPPPDVAAEIVATPADQAAPGVRALGVQGGDGALPLLQHLAAQAPSAIALAAVESLGDVRTRLAADALDEIVRSTSDRAVQKAARRSLYRLSSQGIQASSTAEPTITGTGTFNSREATLYRAVASAYDGSGTRGLWMAAERPLGNIYAFYLAINDVNGLIDFSFRDTTRKRFAEDESGMRERDLMAWVELPLEYARQLVQEAEDVAREGGRLVPNAYTRWAPLIGQPADPLEPLIYKSVSAFEVRVHPTLESETPKLFELPEVEPWFFRPEVLGKWLRQLTEPPTARALLMQENDQQRGERVLRDALKELLPPRVRRGLKRRLEETAYLLLQSDRQADARRAVAAAVTVEDERPLQPPHPFLRALVERSFRIALLVERSGSEPVRLARAP